MNLLLEKIEKLRDELHFHNYNYYVLDKPLISDYDFDMKLKDLINLEKKYPQFYDNNSPTLRVGGSITKSFDSVKHDFPMYSLDNSYSKNDLEDWNDRIFKNIGDDNLQFLCELKFDGVSINLTYKNGRLIKAVTRGDGIEGDDVTKKFAVTERQVVHTKKIDADNEVTVYRDLDTDSIRVDYSSPDVMLDEPVSLSYTRGQADEATKGIKPADEFETFEQGLAARSNGPDDYSIDPEPMIGDKISDLETDVSKLKEYATGKGPTMKEFVASKKRKDRVRKINEGDIGEISDYATKKQGDYYDYDDYASGGIARMLGE